MNRQNVVQAWGRILAGYRPLLSIEITRECPLRCPGCYAYEDAHLGGGITLRQLADSKGEELIHGVLNVVDELRPLHLSIVGGDPMVRYRELEVLLPELNRRCIPVQLVTSAFRLIPSRWQELKLLKIVVSIDGLPAEHDTRRKPATYERILKSIAGSQITVHCTVTGQMMSRPTYLQEFVEFWSARPEVRSIWLSIFTPQKGAQGPEILTPRQRLFVIDEMLRLVELYSKLDLNKDTIAQFRNPPQSPEDCIFARSTETISADLKTRIMPCQFGGTPDCSQCGCIASMALAGVGEKQILGGIRLGSIFKVSHAIGDAVRYLRTGNSPPTASTAGAGLDVHAGDAA
jgi:MoaA/NifB/PqqE/SkfB family radical SAM enzyme